MTYAAFQCTQLADGIQRVTVDWPEGWSHPNCHPYLFLYDKEKGAKCSAPVTLDGKDVFQHGVYILIANQYQPDKLNVLVGASSGETGSKSLLDLLKEQQNCQVSGMRDWHSAIVICDWQDDILIEEINQTKNKKKSFNDTVETKKNEAFWEETDLIQNMFYKIIGNSEVFNIKLRGTQEGCAMANPASNRYNYYIHSALNVLAIKFPPTIKCDTKNAEGNATKMLPKLMLKGEFCLGEKLYGDHNSEAMVCDFGGRILLYQYDNSKSIPKITSINGATEIVRVANNQKGSIPPKTFWHIMRRGEKIKLADL